eukprot:12367902-Alexandrium_andersonii.AAC.1
MQARVGMKPLDLHPFLGPGGVSPWAQEGRASPLPQRRHPQTVCLVSGTVIARSEDGDRLEEVDRLLGVLD